MRCLILKFLNEVFYCELYNWVVSPHIIHIWYAILNYANELFCHRLWVSSWVIQMRFLIVNENELSHHELCKWGVSSWIMKTNGLVIDNADELDRYWWLLIEVSHNELCKLDSILIYANEGSHVNVMYMICLIKHYAH